jgi:hypothetical protein
VKLTRALVACFVEKQHLGVGVFTSTLDGLITALVDDAMQFSLEVGNINQELVLLAVVVSVVKADEPPRIDAVELVVDEAFDIPFQPLGLLALLLVYLGLYGFHLSISCFFSRRSTGTPCGTQQISSVLWLAAVASHSTEQALQAMIIYASCRFYRVSICGFADIPISAGKARKGNTSRKLVFISIFLLHHLATHPLL